MDRALEEALRFRELHPSVRSLRMLSWVLFYRRQYEDAIASFKEILEARAGSPWHAQAYYGIGQSYAALGSYADALEASLQAIEGGSVVASNNRLGSLAYVYALSGQPKQALDLLPELKERDRAAWVGVVYAALGERDLAFEWMGRATPLEMLNIKVGPWYDPLRDDPRFEELLRRMNLE
jgi:tetratricopeptide (TPR) repeat protein